MYLSLPAVMAHNWEGRAVVLVKTLRRLPRLSTEDFFFFPRQTRYLLVFKVPRNGGGYKARYLNYPAKLV
jgi:hypothetical protein